MTPKELLNQLLELPADLFMQVVNDALRTRAKKKEIKALNLFKFHGKWKGGNNLTIEEKIKVVKFLAKQDPEIDLAFRLNLVHETGIDVGHVFVPKDSHKMN